MFGEIIKDVGDTCVEFWRRIMARRVVSSQALLMHPSPVVRRCKRGIKKHCFLNVARQVRFVRMRLSTLRLYVRKMNR